MSELTKEQAIEESFILWTELARSGGTKTEAAKAVGLDHVMDYVSSCPCCEYAKQTASITAWRICESCPVWASHETCKYAYNKWQVATTFEEHREAAAKVLEPITEAWEKISKEKKNGMEWKPIETAPWEIEVLLTGGSGYCKPHDHFVINGYRVRDWHQGEWNDATGTPLSECGWGHPTHWAKMLVTPNTMEC